MVFTFESFLILVITLSILASNSLTLLVTLQTDVLSFINKYFLVSLTLADIFIGVFITPFSFWTSMFGDWIYGDNFCHLQAYLAAIFWIASVYSLMWLSIDHYVAIRKPDRYESLLTPMRCLCWLVFVWVAALSFCGPPLFGVSRARYYPEAHLCIIDWSNQKAYFVTAGVIIMLPPVIALTFSNLYIFTHKYQEKKAVYEKCSDSNLRPDHYFMSFVLGLVYLGSWFPWCMLQVSQIP